jgi:hypothetical protein
LYWNNLLHRLQFLISKAFPPFPQHISAQSTHPVYQNINGILIPGKASCSQGHHVDPFGAGLQQYTAALIHRTSGRKHIIYKQNYLILYLTGFGYLKCIPEILPALKLI